MAQNIGKQLGCANQSLEDTIRKYTAMFDNYEEDWDDALSLEEVTSMIRSEKLDVDEEKFFKICDADGDGQLTKEEFIQGIVGATVADMFKDLCKKYDTNGDGFLDRAEIVSALIDTGFTKADAEAEVKGKIKKCDTDEDGKVTYEEFMVGFLKRRFGLVYNPKKMLGCSNGTLLQTIKKYSDLFDKYRTDTDGDDLFAEEEGEDTLSIDEVKKMIREENFGNDPEALFKFCDSDGDGQVTKKEFIRGIMCVSLEDLFQDICKKINSDGDGIYLDKKDIKGALIECGFKDPTDAAIDNLYKKCDVNNDNRVTHSEFIKGFLKDRFDL